MFVLTGFASNPHISPEGVSLGLFCDINKLIQQDNIPIEAYPLQTECTSPQRVFEGLGKRQVVGKFDGGRMTSDAGSPLLREADRLFDVTGRLAAFFIDHRNPLLIEHLTPLDAQRVMALTLQ